MADLGQQGRATGGVAPFGFIDRRHEWHRKRSRPSSSTAAPAGGRWMRQGAHQVHQAHEREHGARSVRGRAPGRYSTIVVFIVPALFAPSLPIAIGAVRQGRSGQGGAAPESERVYPPPAVRDRHRRGILQQLRGGD